MIKIDLHLHSKASKINGDAIKWISNHHSISKLVENDVKIAAFSDHNILDVNFYLEIKKLAQTANILILPAIEINVVRSDGKIANIIFVFDQNLSIDQLNKISEIARIQIPKRGISLLKCNEIFNEFETIKIPHVGKSDHFKYEDLNQIKYDAIEISNEDDKNYQSVLKKGIITSVVAFSDTHKWNDYPQVHKLITILDNMSEISFSCLKTKLQENKNYFKRRIDD